MGLHMTTRDSSREAGKRLLSHKLSAKQLALVVLVVFIFLAKLNWRTTPHSPNPLHPVSFDLRPWPSCS